MAEILPVASTLPLPSGAATAAAQATLLTELQAKADLTETQPVSLAVAPSTPVTSATFATAAKQPALGTAGSPSADVISIQGVSSGTVVPVSLATAPTTPVTSSTFATVAKQPALGTAGSASADVITVQGIASGTAVPISAASLPTHGVTIADGSDSAEGVTTDAAITTDATGTVSGKLRGLVKWAFERMPAALAAGGGLKIEGVASGVAVPVSGTVTANAGTGFTEYATAATPATPTGGLGMGLVGDTPPPYIDTEIRPLSITNDGRLRVAVVPARSGTPFFNPNEERMWGTLEPDYTYTGSPWTE